MRAPEFWSRDGVLAHLLSPLSAVWCWGAEYRASGVEAYRAQVPVICVGNIIAGGAGKTPVVISLAERLTDRGREAHVLSRGHGGTEIGPKRVDPLRHDAARVGDEPLLLSSHAPTWVSRWRPDGAAAAAAAGAQVIIMDDGFQNPTLAKDLSLVVVDGAYGFGNGRVMPAGPCREPIAAGLARAQAVVLMGQPRPGLEQSLPQGCPVLRAHLEPGQDALALKGRRCLAFAGIGRPDKFFRMLETQVGAILAGRAAFADHHPYTAAEITLLLEDAQQLDALPVTTAKDWVRIPEDLRAAIGVAGISVAWEDEAALDRLLDRVFRP